MSKTNLVFDFSNIAMRALYTCSYTNVGQVSTFDTDEECAILIRKIAMDMAYVSRIFAPDRIILACDARTPWRRSLYDNIEGEEYKGNRQKDATKNWNKIFEHINNFKEILKDKGFVISEIPNAEADDLAALWKKESFNNDDNVILISSDKDWKQLVEFDGKKFCVCFNPIASVKGKRQLFLTDSCLNWMLESSHKSVDIFFNNYNSYKNTLADIKSKDAKIEFSVINPDIVLLDKIMCGDDGDNVPSIYEFYKNGKRVRMTPARSKKLCEDLNIHNVKDLCDVADNSYLLPALEQSFKKEIDDVDLKDRVLRQRKLVELNTDIFPDKITSAFKYHAEDVKDDGYVHAASLTLDIMLKGSQYLDDDYDPHRPKEAGIFDNLKGLEKYIPGYKNTKTLF